MNEKVEKNIIGKLQLWSPKKVNISAPPLVRCVTTVKVRLPLLSLRCPFFKRGRTQLVRFNEIISVKGFTQCMAHSKR